MQDLLWKWMLLMLALVCQQFSLAWWVKYNISWINTHNCEKGAFSLKMVHMHWLNLSLYWHLMSISDFFGHVPLFSRSLMVCAVRNAHRKWYLQQHEWGIDWTIHHNLNTSAVNMAFKGIVHPKMIILLSFIHSNLCDFLSAELKRRFLVHIMKVKAILNPVNLLKCLPFTL